MHVTVWESELADARVRACAHVGCESRPGALTSVPPTGVKRRSFISILQVTKLRQTEAECQQLLGMVQGRHKAPFLLHEDISLFQLQLSFSIILIQVYSIAVGIYVAYKVVPP